VSRSKSPPFRLFCFLRIFMGPILNKKRPLGGV
jgi:hypothetical protein